MEYAVEVENYTLTKENNLVLNVDGSIGSPLQAQSQRFYNVRYNDVSESTLYVPNNLRRNVLFQ
ncbi:hypothetical protein JHK85_025499 [Glycine max]|nr:hypothetical protein JHK85_025499 [Glycine max]